MGNKFTFDVAFNGITIHHNCTVEDNQIQMETKSDSGDFPGMKLTLKRAGAAPEAPHQLRTAPVPFDSIDCHFSAVVSSASADSASSPWISRRT